MRARDVIAEAETPAGEPLTLSVHAGQFIVLVGGEPLMSSAAHHSEERMAEIGCAGLLERRSARVLVGGLGLGYTLRAVLDLVPEKAEVVVAELMPAIVEWNRGPVAHLANRPLDDPRVELVVGDVRDVLEDGSFDTILLDVDNGPEALTVKQNAALYGAKGLRRLYGALRPGGVLVVWSAFQAPAFPAALTRAGLAAEVVKARARGKKGGRHTLYVGRRGGAPRTGESR